MKVYLEEELPDNFILCHNIFKCQLTNDILEADIVAYPSNFVRDEANFKYLDYLVQLANEHKLWCVLFYDNDDEMPLWSTKYPDNLLVFRTSLLRSCRRNNEYVLPVFVDTMRFARINRTLKPKIGFCGKVHKLRRERKKSMKFLDKTRTDCNFIRRLHFSGSGNASEKDIKEFIVNINTNHFTICARGDGNYSIRFYEVLGRNRIPIYVDNDSCLPFEDEIDWNSIIPIVKFENIESITDIVINYWNKYLTQKELDACLLRCGDMITEYLNTNFLWEYIERKIKF